ncbi:MAG: exodeoxyribonuclease V subunit gamma, partial [Myxococcales bacterium]
MIHVRYSNRIEELVAELAGALPPPGDIGALFEGPWLVIPSRPLELYVDLELARRRGISGNMDTLSVRGAFARLCAEAHPDVVLIDGGHVVGELLALLSEPALENRYALGDLQDYLVGAGTAPDAVNRRRVDLARALGGLFDTWTLTRPELLATWRDATAGADGDAGATSPLARAEHAMWTGLFGAGGRFQRRGEADGRRYLTLDAYLADNLDRAW